VRGYPDYGIEDKKMYDEYLRMSQEAVGTDYYREIGNEGNSNSKEVDQKLESLEHEVASGSTSRKPNSRSELVFKSENFE
jgi:hypothetical protein